MLSVTLILQRKTLRCREITQLDPKPLLLQSVLSAWHYHRRDPSSRGTQEDQLYISGASPPWAPPQFIPAQPSGIPGRGTGPAEIR